MAQSVENTASGYVTTAIRIPRDVLALLRQMAVDRAARCGCRVRACQGITASSDLLRGWMV